MFIYFVFYINLQDGGNQRMRMKTGAVIAASAITMAAISAFAGADHAEFVKGPFKTGQDVTKACLECHSEAGDQVLSSSHWKWKGPPKLVKGLEKSKVEYGKANLINNFCISIEGGDRCDNQEFCAKCHPSYGWTDNTFDFTNKNNIDCLVCHTSDRQYKKGLAGQPDPKAIAAGKLDLEKAAQKVGKPGLANCGVCHFYGGGGDAVKHGDLDSTMEKPKRDHDVHMGTTDSGGLGMTCQQCHKTSHHQIAGASTFLATYSERVACEDCHTGANAPHQKSKNGALINRHLATVACQTCHIPVFAKGQATKMSWDWSDVGKDIEAGEQFDKETFMKHKGTFTWGKDVVPTYAWYNGTIERYLKGQKIKDPSKVVNISRPLGDITDKKAKIFPFKVHTGKQPMDSLSNCLLIPQTHNALWKDYDWENALKKGAKGSQVPYSGKYQFVKTAFYGSINHEVATRDKALQCGECHMGGTRMNWKALGYKGDPMQTGGRFAKTAAKK